MENQVLAQLAKRLNLTEPEPEEFILTKEECESVIENEIASRKKYMAWKIVNLGFSEQEALSRIAQTNWGEEIDKDKLLQIANSNKHQNIWHEKQRSDERERIEANRKALVERCDARYMFKLMKWSSENQHGKPLIVNEHNKKLITTICYLLSSDERFETELGYSFKKGLLIRGVAGVGKTHIVKCLEDNELFPIRVLSMIEITDMVKENGEYEISMDGKKIIYLDDVGTEEPTVNHYGTKVSFFKNFIETVYLQNQHKTFSNILISTNHSFAELETKYGFRVRSRMKDMFNVVDVTGKDMRGE